MPVRLSGILDWSGGLLHDRAQEEAWEASYPAPAPWRRATHRSGPNLRVVLDACGASSPAAALGVDDEAQIGVGGTIRLDRADELRDQLGAASDVGDGALIMAAYRKWGALAFSRLTGDFAFVLWDDRAQTRYLVRDPFGVRRLHYAECGDALLFSTDVEGILAWRPVDRTPDAVTILDNLLARYQTRERTFFRAIKRVPPGHHLVARRGHVSVVRHLEIPRCAVQFRSLPEYGEAFRYELGRSVAERLPASGRVACHVSGGLDSMSIAALAGEELARSQRSQDLVLLNARFAGLSSDEGFVAHELARHLRLPLLQWNGRVPEVSDLERSRAAWPFGRSSSAGAWQGDLKLAGTAGAPVILGGAGGNQMSMESQFFRDSWRERGLPGYGRALFALVRGRSWRWPRRRLWWTLAEARDALRAALGRRAVSSAASLGDPAPAWLGWKLRQVRGCLPDLVDQSPAEPETGSWMGDALWKSLVDDPGHVWTLEHEDARATEQGLEFRFPYLSWSLLALVLSVPARVRPPGPTDRTLQRLALRGVLPERLRLRDTYVNFNESVTLNTQAAFPLIEALLTRGPWAADGFVVREEAVGELSALSRTLGKGFTAEHTEAWRQIRDIAALEAWLRRV